MKEAEPPEISVIIATRDRVRSLGALLASLNRLHAPPVAYEIIVVDNGSKDETPRLLREWSAPGGGKSVVEVAEPGKSRAMNDGIAGSRGKWLVFLDDDVVVEPDYLVEVWEFCRQTDCAAAQGTVLLPQEATADAELCALLQRYTEMFPRVIHPPEWRPVTLIGANMVVRRDMFLRVGVWNERLGAGITGFGEDDDMAERILRAGGRIGYIANAKVTHEIDRRRLTQEAFLERARKLGWTDYIRKSPGVLSWILPRMTVTGLRLVVTSLCGMKNHRQRALARWHRYRGALEYARRNDK